MTGPLQGVRVVEFEGANPTSMCGMVLADLGASVVILSRPKNQEYKLPPEALVFQRGKKGIEIDLKSPESAVAIKELIKGCDILIEGYRPGVMERLGFGPEECLASNPRLVFTRVTGWGQRGPMRDLPGHDLNFVALSGVLHGLGRAGQPPTPPMNLLGNFAGGTFFSVIGILAALLQARATGLGQEVQVSTLQGCAYLATGYYSLLAAGQVSPERGRNLVDTGSALYEVYECSDGKYISIAAMEEKFRLELASALQVTLETKSDYGPSPAWDRDKAVLKAAFMARTRDEWWELLRSRNVCAAPVLTPNEAPLDPHNVAEQIFYEGPFGPLPSPGPHFSKTRMGLPHPFEHLTASELRKVATEWQASNGHLSERRPL